MNKIIWVMAKRLLLVLMVLSSSVMVAQTDVEFWFAVPEVTSGHNGGAGEPTFLHLSAMDADAEVTITMPMESSFLPITVFVPASTTRKVDLTGYIRDGYVAGSNNGIANQANIMELGLPGDYGVVTNKGIHIESTNYITAYLERNNINNNDIWALKGTTAFGDDFYVPSQTHDSNGGYSPSALYSIDIIATEDAVVRFKLPGTKTAKGFPNMASVTLKKGQTLCLVANSTSILDHLGGTHIWTIAGEIVVQWKDDSVNGNNCKDLMGDQLIPTKYAGNEYVVMRGQLAPDVNGSNNTTEEYVYIMSLHAGTEIEFNIVGADGGAVVPGNITLGAPGTIEAILLNRPNGRIDALHMKSLGEEPFIVYHVAGFGCEKGAAILPSIKGCTGSTDVSFSRSTSESFFLNIMCKEKFIDDFWMYIDGQPNPIQIPQNWFTRIPGTEMDSTLGLDSTEWYFLDKSFNEFTNAHGPFPAIPVNRVTKVVNTDGLFHLAVINGGASSGCRYGYFSDFSDNLGEAVIGGANTDFLFYCAGDTVQLQARGGVKYEWKNVNTNPHYSGTFVDPVTLSSPRIAPPTGQMFYEAKITRACYPELLNRDTLIYVSAIGYPEVMSGLDTTMLSPNNCSPITFKMDNVSTGANRFVWDINYFNDSSSHTLVGVNNPDPGELTFVNQTNSTQNVEVLLNSSFTYNCADTTSMIIPVHPEIRAVSTKGAKSGCQQDVMQEFYATGSSQTYTTGIWDWGDGTGQESFVAADSANTFSHIFSNLTNFDTAYYVRLILLDSVCGCVDTAKVDTVFVPGVARARYAINNKKGCSPLEVEIDNLSNGIVDYSWWFVTGNNSSTTPPDYSAYFDDTTITYSNTTNVPIEYYVFLITDKTNLDGTHCYDTCGVDTIIVYPEFDINIDQAPQSGCTPLNVSFSSTQNPPLPNMTYYWNFGEGSTSGKEDPGDKIFTNLTAIDTIYQVSLVAESEYLCRDTAPIVGMETYAFVDSRFTVAPDTVGCSPFEITLQNNTALNSVKNEVWDLGIGATGVPSPSAPFNVTYNNNSGVVTNPVITLSNSNGHAACDTTYTKVLTVKSGLAVLFVYDKDTICHGDSIQFTNNSRFNPTAPITGAMAEYYWDFGDGTSSTMENPIHTFRNSENNGFLSQKFIVSLSVTVNGCSEVYTDSVYVYPELVPQFSADSYVLCTPTDALITNNSKGAQQYTWSFSDGSPNETTTNVIHTFTNPIPSNVNTITTVTLYAQNGSCILDISKNFTLYPELDAQFTINQPDVCEPSPVQFTNVSTGGPLSSLLCEWSWGDGVEKVDNAATVDYTFKNKTPNDVLRDVELKITNGLGCSDSVTVLVPVYSHVDASFTVSDTVSCSPFVVGIVNNSSPNSYVGYTWNFGGGIPAPDATNPVTVTFQNNTDVNESSLITLTNDNGHGCTKTFSRTVTTSPAVVARFSMDSALVCHEGNVDFTNTSSFVNGIPINTGANVEFAWDFGDGATSNEENPSHIYLNTENNGTTAQSYTVTLTINVDGCIETITSTVSVYPKVQADFTSTEYIFCSPNLTTLTNISTGANSYLWQFTDTASISTTSKNDIQRLLINSNAENINTITVTLTSSNSFCSSTRVRDYSVYPEVVVDFTQDVTEGCNPLDVNFTNNSTGRLAYRWDFDDGQTSPNKSPSHTFSHIENNDKVFDVKLVVTQEVTGCMDSTSINITTYSYVEAKFGLTKFGLSKSGASGEIVGGCTPFDVVITDSSVTNGTWEWDFGDGTTDIHNSKPAPIGKTYSNLSNTDPLQNVPYTISLVVTNTRGCAETETRDLEVYPRTTPDFITDYEGCSPHAASFTNLTIDDNNTSYFWEYGDGASSNDENPFYVLNNYNKVSDTIYTVKLTTTTYYNCIDDIQKQVRVFPKPLAQIIPDRSNGCSPLTVTFTDGTIGKSGFNVDWDFDDGNSTSTGEGGVVSHTFHNQNASDQINTYDVKIIVETNAPEGCMDTVTYSIHAYPEVEVDFEHDTAGCSPHRVEFVNISNGAVSEYEWDFGYNGENSYVREPVFSYYNRTGSIERYVVTLVGASKYGCKADTSHTVTVYPTPIPDFDIDEPWQIYPDTTFTITNLSLQGDYDYYWNIGDGTSEFFENDKAFDIRYTGWGDNANNNEYMVTLRADGSHCDTLTTKVLRLIPPRPEIRIVNSEPAGCVPLTVNFDIETNYGNDFIWDFDDGGSSNELEPTYEFVADGIYNVKVTIKGDGGDSFDYIPVVVYPLPEVDFRFDPEFVMLPNDKVQFYNTTQGGETFSWDFGDGGTSDLVNPSYLYTAEGFYTVVLTSTSEEGCVDSMIHHTQIEVSGAGKIRFPNTFFPNETSPADGSYGGVLLEENKVFHPHYKQVEKYNLYIYNRWGEQVFVTQDIEEGWNGRYNNNGKDMTQGVYYWKSSGEFYNGTSFNMSGDVTLIRK